jgi:hypothetical protein
VIHLPYGAALTSTGGGSGTVAIGKGESGESPGAAMTCTIFGFPVKCTATAAAQTWKLSGGNPSHLIANEVKMSVSGTFCPAEATFSAEYEVTSPKPLFVAAKVPFTKLCENAKVDKCGNPFKKATTLEAAATNAVKFEFKFKDNPVKVACGQSEMKGKTTADEGTPLFGELTSLTFAKCDNGCAITAKSLPYQIFMEATGGGKGRFGLRSSGVGHPELEFKCTAETCSYEAEDGEIERQRFNGGAPATVEVDTVLLRTAASDDDCGSSLFWGEAIKNTIYSFSVPKAGAWLSRG